MIPYQFNNLEEYGSFSKVEKLLSSSFLVSSVCTFFDRLQLKLQLKTDYVTKSLLHFKEFNLMRMELISEESSSAFIRGFSKNLDHLLTFNLFRFYTYDLWLKYAPQYLDIQNNQVLVPVGIFLATSFATFISSPSDILRKQLYAESLAARNSEKYSKIVKILESAKTHKVFISGLPIKMINNNLIAFTELSVFVLFNKLYNIQKMRKADISQYIIPVLSASIVSSLISNPLEMIHSRIVARRILGKSIPDQYFQKMINYEGYSMFLKGLLPNIIRSSLGNLVMFSYLQYRVNIHEANRLRQEAYESIVSSED